MKTLREWEDEMLRRRFAGMLCAQRRVDCFLLGLSGGCFLCVLGLVALWWYVTR